MCRLWNKNLKSYVRHEIESRMCRHNTVEHARTWLFKIPITQHFENLTIKYDQFKLKCIEFNERNLFVLDFRWNNKIVKKIIDQEWIMKKHKNNSGSSKFGNQSKDYKYSDQFRGVVKGQIGRAHV